jgi:hypothetical protein
MAFPGSTAFRADVIPDTLRVGNPQRTGAWKTLQKRGNEMKKLIIALCLAATPASAAGLLGRMLFG